MNNFRRTTDVIDSVFNNGVKILSPIIIKTATTGGSFLHNNYKNKVLNSNLKGFVTGAAKPLGIAIAYGFVAYAWGQTTISIFSDDSLQRAEQRGYKLK